MLKVIQSPAKYLQGPDAAVLFGQYAKNLAESFFVIADDFVMKLAGEKVVNGLQSHDIRCHAERFNGECSHAEINRLMAILKKQGCRGVVGIGGGKTLDTAKAIGYYQKLPVVVIPTIASTDAPTSALSVIYTEAGEFEEYLIYPKNPDMVVMDTAIIAKAPVRLLVSGMGTKEPQYPKRVRNELRFRELTVLRVERVGAAFQRIVLGGEALEGFVSQGFDDHTKLFFPEAGAAFTPPQVTEEGINWGDGVRPATRDYTPLYDAERHELAYDFFIHDGGIASSWALAANVGDKLVIGGPHPAHSGASPGQTGYWLSARHSPPRRDCPKAGTPRGCYAAKRASPRWPAAVPAPASWLLPQRKAAPVQCSPPVRWRLSRNLSYPAPSPATPGQSASRSADGAACRPAHGSESPFPPPTRRRGC